MSDILDLTGALERSSLEFFIRMRAVSYDVVYYKIAQEQAPLPNSDDVNAINLENSWEIIMGYSDRPR